MPATATHRHLPRAVITLAVAATLLIAGFVLLRPDAPPVAVLDPWMFEPANPDVAGVFMDLRNDGRQDDRLVGGESTLADVVEVHETVTDTDGSTMMRELEDGLPLPAGATVELRPGGYHVMLRGIAGSLTPGDTIELTLRFERADPVTVAVRVRPRGDMPPGGGHGEGGGSMP